MGASSIKVWLLVGTRSWGKVLLLEACKALPLDVDMFVLAENTDLKFRLWLKEVGLEKRVATVDNLPRLGEAATGVAIIANSAPIHFKSAFEALEAGYHAVVEKPMTLSAENSRVLIEKAKDLGLSIFSTNVFLFTEYFQIFRDMQIGEKGVRSLTLVWTDPKQERRHGGWKTYDSGTPIIFDVVPHIVSLVWFLFGDQAPGKAQIISVQAGGSRVKFFFEYGGVPVEVLLARNAKSRTREIRAVSDSAVKIMDFSNEPATLRSFGGSNSTSYFTVGSLEKRPVAQVIDAVSSSVLSPNPDPRLSSSIAIAGNRVIDSLVDSYMKQQVSFLHNVRSGAEQEKKTVGYSYAIKEAGSVVSRLLPSLHHNSNLAKILGKYRDFV